MRRLQQQFFMLGPPDWLKMKNAAAPAVKREAGEDGSTTVGQSHGSDEMRAVVESEWPELAHKLPLAKPQH
jgi:hypothetical protein